MAEIGVAVIARDERARLALFTAFSPSNVIALVGCRLSTRPVTPERRNDGDDDDDALARERRDGRATATASSVERDPRRGGRAAGDKKKFRKRF